MTTLMIAVPRALLERALTEWCTQEGANDKFQAQCQLRRLLNPPAEDAAAELEIARLRKALATMTGERDWLKNTLDANAPKGNPKKVIMPPFKFITFDEFTKLAPDTQARAAGYNEALALWYELNVGIEYTKASKAP